MMIPMKMLLSVVFIVLLVDFVQCQQKAAQLKTVDMTKHCNGTLTVEEQTEVTISSHDFSVITNCLNCTYHLTTQPHNNILASLLYLHTEQDQQCDLNRLDFYDGAKVNQSALISPRSGVCGSSFPVVKQYQSRSNNMTLHLRTLCNSSITQHGEIKVLVTAIKNELYNKSFCVGEFKCDSGDCIKKGLVCDGHADCKDKSDETNCPIRNGTCPGEFECKDGHCVDKDLVCNGKKDCPDNSDEAGCHNSHHGNRTCPGKFECLHGTCIKKDKVCDGNNDCGDNSDETGCPNRKLLLYILIGIAGLILIVFTVILIILCCRYCCFTLSAYSRLK